jgi:hypothetical protein
MENKRKSVVTKKSLLHEVNRRCREISKTFPKKDIRYDSVPPQRPQRATRKRQATSVSPPLKNPLSNQLLLQLDGSSLETDKSLFENNKDNPVILAYLKKKLTHELTKVIKL